MIKPAFTPPSRRINRKKTPPNKPASTKLKPRRRQNQEDPDNLSRHIKNTTATQIKAPPNTNVESKRRICTYSSKGMMLALKATRGGPLTAAKTITQRQFDEHRGLNETAFHGNRFESVVFEGSLEDHTFENCVFQSCSFNSASLRHAHFESCKFHDEVALAGTSFRYADLSHATFHQCDLTNSDLSQSKWYDVTISATKAVG